MKDLKEAIKITVKKVNRELYNFCDLAFKIMKDDHTAKIININKQLLECFRVYRSSSFMNNAVYQNAVGPHSRILLCFQTHNVSQAVEEMRRHLEITTLDMKTIHSGQES